jgi:hypothetical protein
VQTPLAPISVASSTASSSRSTASTQPVTVEPTPPTSPTSSANISGNSTGVSAEYRDFLSYLQDSHQPSLFYTQHPQNWSVLEVAAWLHSNNISEYIIDIFLKEGITGRLLLHFTKEDMSSLGIRLFRERMELGILIRELRSTWRITDGNVIPSSSAGVYAANLPVVAPSFAAPVFLEGGKGALSTDAPPAYNNY